MSEKILLLDGHSIANRAFFGVPLLTNSKGFHTNALFGFFSILWKAMDDVKPDRLAVAFDTHAPTFRHEVFAEYKGTRSPMQPELCEQIPKLEEMVRAAGIPVFSQAGLEADDIIGSLAKRYGAEGCEVYVLSGDRDLLQLVDRQITLLIPKTKKGGTETEVYREAEVEEKYGVSPEGYLNMKALMGDASDNIPGVPGVGEKTASKLIRTFGSLEEVLAHADEAGGAKLCGNLKEFAEQARLSLWLATIKTDCELAGEAALLGDESFATPEFIAYLKEFELKSLLARVMKNKAPMAAEKKAGAAENAAEAAMAEAAVKTAVAASFPDRELLHVRTPEEWQALVGKLVPGEALALEVSADREGGVAALALGNGRLLACVEPGGAGENLSLFDDPGERLGFARIARDLAPLLEDLKTELLSFDTKKTYKAFRKEGVTAAGFVFDGMVAAYLLNPTKASYTPDELSAAYLGVQALSEEEVLGSGAKKLALAELPAARRLAYLVQTPRIVLDARETVVAALADAGMERLYFDVELPLTRVLAEMELVGIRCEPAVLRDFGVYLSGEIERLAESIYAQAGERFNINSPKQLGEILFDKLGLPAGKKTKTGYSTSADILEKLAEDYPVVADILNYRQLTKLQSTYVEGLTAFIDPEDGRIHSTFHQTVTATGRLSSADPNLQNIPIRMELGRKLRKAFVPASRDWFFMDADYSQIELRLLAHMSGDEKMIAAYREGRDIHRMTAAQVLHKAPEDVTPAERSSAKAVNFGIIYGMSAFGLGDGLGISQKEAGAYIKDYFAQYPKVEGFLNECVRKARETGCGETLFGRRRPIEELKNTNFIQRSFGERVAKNMPIQGTAADIIKIAMLRVFDRLGREGLRSRLLLQVHDELLIEVWRPEEEAVRRILREEMEGAAALSVPLSVEIECGEDWYEAK